LTADIQQQSAKQAVAGDIHDAGSGHGQQLVSIDYREYSRW